MFTLEEKWDCLENCAGVSEEALRIVTDVAGYNDSTLEDVLYSVIGHREFEDIPEEELHHSCGRG